MDQINGTPAAREAAVAGGAASSLAAGSHRPLPCFSKIVLTLGDKVILHKPLNMSKPKMKLKIGFGGSNLLGTAASPVVQTPLATPGGHKLKLSFGKASSPATPTSDAVSKPAKTKAGRALKPSQKLIASKKRPKDDSDNESDIITVNIEGRTLANPKKKIKFSIGQAQTPKTPAPILKAKFKGKPPKRPLGEGYDSEASDREEDPTIEEEWILRMLPGEDCDYLRQMINEKRIGLPRSQGGAEVQFRFYHNEGRRAVVTIRGHHYAATMVDLPCVIEGMKSWDKKGWYKSADICQMLLVFAPIKNEGDAETIELPKVVDPNTFQYPHGLTAPMRNARKSRFRKRIRREAIEAVEEAVEALLAADAAALETRYEMIEPDLGSRTPGYGYGSPRESEGEIEFSANEEEDAEGEEDEGDYFNQDRTQDILGEAMDEDFEAEMEAAFNNDLESGLLEAPTPSSQAVADTPMVTGEIGVRAAADEDSGDESIEDDDDDEDDDSEEDEDERTRAAELQGAREDILEMEKTLEQLADSYASQLNPILKNRLKDRIDKTKAELQLKKSAIGEGDED